MSNIRRYPCGCLVRDVDPRIIHRHFPHCPRRQCRGRLAHSWVNHWLGWMRR